jgi:hypothetical protein
MTRYAHALSSHTPKDTLLTLNTLPESSHDDSLLVLGLVSRHLNMHPFSKPCGPLVRGYASDALYPINFVVKHPNHLDLQRWPALRRLKPAGVAGLFPGRRQFNQLAANWKQ